MKEVPNKILIDNGQKEIGRLQTGQINFFSS